MEPRAAPLVLATAGEACITSLPARRWMAVDGDRGGCIHSAHGSVFPAVTVVRAGGRGRRGMGGCAGRRGRFAAGQPRHLRVAAHPIARLRLSPGEDLRPSRPDLQLCPGERDAGRSLRRNRRLLPRGRSFRRLSAPQIHPLATDVGLDFEGGRLRAVTIILHGQFDEATVEQAFGLSDDALPPNILSVSVQACSADATCLQIEGFDHMGAGDVDCPEPAVPPDRR